MSLEVAISYGEQIRQRHQAGIQADADLLQAMLRKIEITRETGELIADAKGDLNRIEFAKAVNFLSDEAVRSYLKFARSNPEPINDLERAVIAIRAALQPSGALEFPDGHGIQISHDPPGFFAWSSKMVMQFKVGFQKYLAVRPLKTWDTDTRERFAYSLRPIIKVHKMLTESQRKP